MRLEISELASAPRERLSPNCRAGIRLRSELRVSWDITVTATVEDQKDSREREPNRWLAKRLEIDA